jgi:dTDP-4-dehydrorhamnose 3,5-epimerase
VIYCNVKGGGSPVDEGSKIRIPTSTDIAGCDIVPIVANRDERGCLNEIFRQTWPGVFLAVQWNACVSQAGSARGVHVHLSYSEFYTLPKGRVIIGLVDIRKESASFRRSLQFEWSDGDDCAVVVPAGVAHIVLFQQPSVLVYGLSGFWKQEIDNLGCRWDDPDLGFVWPIANPNLSDRDYNSGSFAEMVEGYEEALSLWKNSIPPL